MKEICRKALSFLKNMTVKQKIISASVVAVILITAILVPIIIVNTGKCDHVFDNACDTTCNECGETREGGAPITMQPIATHPRHARIAEQPKDRTRNIPTITPAMQTAMSVIKRESFSTIIPCFKTTKHITGMFAWYANAPTVKTKPSTHTIMIVTPLVIHAERKEQPSMFPIPMTEIALRR